MATKCVIPTIECRREILIFPGGFLQISVMLSAEETDIPEDNRAVGNTFPDEVMVHIKCVLCCCYWQDSEPDHSFGSLCGCSVFSLNGGWRQWIGPLSTRTPSKYEDSTQNRTMSIRVHDIVGVSEAKQHVSVLGCCHQHQTETCNHKSRYHHHKSTRFCSQQSPSQAWNWDEICSNRFWGPNQGVSCFWPKMGMKQHTSRFHVSNQVTASPKILSSDLWPYGHPAH